MNNFESIYKRAQSLRESAISLENNKAEVVLESSGAWAKVKEIEDYHDFPEGDWDYAANIHVVVPAHSGDESIWVSFKGIYTVLYGKPEVLYNTGFFKDEDADVLVFKTKSDAMEHDPDNGERIIQSGLSDRRLESIVDFAMDREYETHSVEWFTFDA